VWDSAKLQIKPLMVAGTSRAIGVASQRRMQNEITNRRAVDA
jgi:hypothetical protein